MQFHLMLVVYGATYFNPHLRIIKNQITTTPVII